MNKNDIVKHYNQFLKDNHIKAKDFIISAGGACVMHGIRNETNDMDMAVPEELFNKLLKSGKYKTHTFTGWFSDLRTSIEYNEYIDLHIGDIVVKKENQDIVFIDGVCCYSAETLLKQKIKMNRPKDQEDIIKLKEILKKRYNKPIWTTW